MVSCSAIPSAQFRGIRLESKSLEENSLTRCESLYRIISLTTEVNSPYLAILGIIASKTYHMYMLLLKIGNLGTNGLSFFFFFCEERWNCIK